MTAGLAPYADGDGDSGVAGNEWLTALAGALLLVLIAIEVVTTANLRALMSAHVFVGVLLVGPLAVKLGSTGHRFVRYYTGAPAYVRKGPPQPFMRVLAVPLVATTVVLIGSGAALLVTGPSQPGSLIAHHNVSTVIFLPLIAVHAVAYLRRSFRLVAADGRAVTETRATRSALRISMNVGALIAGLAAAVLLLPTGSPWVTWAVRNIGQAPAPLIVGTVIAVLALLAVRPLRRT